MDFLEFLNHSVSPYHTVNELKQAFAAHGFIGLAADVGEKPQAGAAYFFERSGALIALRMPTKPFQDSKFCIALAHTDFPALKIAPNPDGNAAGIKTLHSEIYGSPLFASWLDRDLGYAGVLAVEKEGKIQQKIVRGDKLFRIPQLAIHLNRGVNQEGLKVDPQRDLNALWTADAASSASGSFTEALQQFVAKDEKLLDFDIQLFDAQPATLGGFHDEWIYSGRLDNLSSCHAIAEAMLAAKPAEKDFQVACFFNNEEVGSVSREGASGNFLRAVLEYVWSAAQPAADMSGVSLPFALEKSLALSIDMAHGEHPNHPEKHDANHAPILGGGIVLKTNAQKRYASDVMSSAKLRQLCEKAGTSLQVFISRNDMPCGSTVGPAISASLGIPTVDIGEPMLSMHSIREMTAAKDHQDMIQVVKVLYNFF